ncbi:hypothetical protein QBC32DRAFT_391268 [Pseudoneurospora amorphoporcata]|uniref:Uncharacterized protein n=1 Tax=Pseudoneurospora amorphoporcata TaxID=241081 RepID=A0AAN6SG47_9PEZI|nr:hypothetical protein QBC32DRAFT_391268 [Pseudoneurospora amorphoporcata]
MSTTTPTYRYQYRPSSSHIPTSNFSLSPPRNTLPYHYLESPTNIFLQSSTNPQQPEKIIIRQVGGPGDNHVQWACPPDIVPYQPDSEEFPLAGARERISGNCGGGGGGGGGKRGIKSLKSFESHVHGVVHTASWPNNDVGDRLWLRSDQPIIKGRRRSVPVVNLDKGVVSREVCISHVTWHPQKRELSNINTTITFIGAEYRHGQGPRRGGPFRMCIVQDPSSSSSSSSSHDEDGIIEMIFLEESEACFEDVKPISPVHNHSHSHPHALSPPPTELRILGLGDSNHISRQLRGPRGTAIFDEADSRTMDDDDDDDDNLSQTSFASSTKGKLAMDLVARSLSIFNFNAAMLDLAALSNQSMDGFVRDIDEQPEAEDNSDEEEDEEGEQRVWSDCESIQSI